MTEPAGARVARLLAMVPWLVTHQGIDLTQAASDLGISVDQLNDDLELLFMCGYGSMTDELIDVSTEGGRIFIANADTLARPLRLTRAEALTLVVALRALAYAEGVTDHAVVERTMAKLENAIGARTVPPEGSSVAGRGLDDVVIDARLADASAESTRALVAQALRGRRRLRVRYLVPSRDESTERDVDPMRLLHLDGRWYLEGWCHRAEATRLFRLDRVEDIQALDADGTPPPDATARDLSAGTFVPGSDDPVVTLDLERSWEWVAEYYPIETREERSGMPTRVTLRASDPAWVVRLALRAGGGVRVVDPAELAAQVEVAAGAALAAYGHDAETPAGTSATPLGPGTNGGA